MTQTIWRIDGEQLYLDLHPGQTRAWRSDRRFVFVLAGTQGGKTSFGPWWLWREITRCGAGDYIAATASYDLFKLKMLPELRTVFEHVLKIGRYWSGERIIELRDPTTGEFHAKRADDTMWGRIILRSAESSGGLEAASVNAAWLDECGQDSFSVESWEAVQRRLSLSQGRVLGTTTLYNMGWLLADIYQPWKDGRADIDVIQFPSYQNPAFPKEEYDRAREELPAWRFSMFYDGQFMRPAGLIYADFSEAHLEVSFPIRADWPRVVGIDFGGANVAILWLAQDEGGTWHLYREWLGGGMMTADYVRIAREGLQGAENVRAFGGASSEGQQRRDWTAAGLRVLEPPVRGVEPGIDRVTTMIRRHELRVCRLLRGVRDELGTYRRVVDAQGNPTDVIADKNTFHRLDALRYAACGIKRQKREVRSYQG